MNKLFSYAASLQNTGIHLTRWGIVIVLLWIGGLKAFKYDKPLPLMLVPALMGKIHGTENPALL